MQKLLGHRVYLAGPMDRVKDRGRTWRNRITPTLSSMGLNVLNALKKPTSAGLENDDTAEYKNKLKKKQEYDKLSSLMKEIRAVDLRMVDTSDFMIASLDLDVHLCGTLEEIFWANRQKKPILIRMEQGKKNTPDWLFGTIPHEFIFDDWESLVYYVNEVNNGNNIETYNRWCFFNY